MRFSAYTLTLALLSPAVFAENDPAPVEHQAIAETSFEKTINNFKQAGASAAFFDSAYGFAVFPTIAKGGIAVGGAFGEGRVYEQGQVIGKTELGQLTIGFQLGGQAYSQIIFFEDERALREFTSGSFEFGAEASAVAVTLSANAKAGTGGTSAGASTSTANAKNLGQYYKGMAVFTLAKGGLMYEASIGGQAFKFEPLPTAAAPAKTELSQG